MMGIEIFAGLGAEDRSALAKLCQGRRFEANQQVVSHKDENNDVYFLVSGSVRITIYSVSGREISFRDQRAGEMFGELAAVDGKPRSAYVVALSDALLASMPAEDFWQVLKRYPVVAEATLKRLASLVRLLTERVFEFSTMAVKNRIHAELLRIARENVQSDNTATINSPPTHADIASRVSTHREAVTRELNEMERSGIIARGDGVMRVPDVPKLSRMVEEVLGR